MCKSWAFIHTCGHTLTFRLSTCRGQFTHTTRKSDIALSLCRGAPSWGFKSQLKCGACCKADEEQRLEAEIAQIRFELADAEDWLIYAEQGYSSEMWRLHKKYPDGRFKKAPRPEKGPEPTRRSSILRTEVKVEDLPEEAPHIKSDPATWSKFDEQWNWAANLASLDDEIAENEKEREDNGLPSLSLDAYDVNGWIDPPSIDNEPSLAEPDSPSPLSEPESLSPVRETLYLSRDYAMIEDDDDDEGEDLFTFPAERFKAVTAPLEEHALHAMSLISSSTENANSPRPGKRSRRDHSTNDLAEQVAQGIKAMHGYGGGSRPVSLTVTG